MFIGIAIWSAWIITKWEWNWGEWSAHGSD